MRKHFFEGRPSHLLPEPPCDGLTAAPEALADLPQGQPLSAQRAYLTKQFPLCLPLLLPLALFRLGRRPARGLAPAYLVGAWLGSLADNPGLSRPLGDGAKADAGLLGGGAAGVAPAVEAEGFGFLLVGVACGSCGHAMLTVKK